MLFDAIDSMEETIFFEIDDKREEAWLEVAYSNATYLRDSYELE